MNRRGEGRRRHWEDPKDQAVPILPAAACCKLGARHAGEWCLRASWEAVSCDADYAEPRTSLRPAGFHLIKEHLSGSRFTKGREQKNTSTLASRLIGCCTRSQPSWKIQGVSLCSEGLQDHFSDRKLKTREVKRLTYRVARMPVKSGCQIING